jgi:ubiquitin carboxyl-terminal hydrolase 8
MNFVCSRFYNDGWWKKRMTVVDFPSDSLDLTSRVKGQPFSQDIRAPRSNFQLQAVSNHYGSMDGGHYTAYCRQNRYKTKIF